LIEKKYLTFDELALRWNLNKKDIHILVSNSELTPTLIWSGWVIVLGWQHNPEESDKPLLVARTNKDGNPLEVMCSDWIFLRQPKILGPYQYSFTLASSSTDELKSPWYQLTEFEGRTFSTPAKIDQNKIEEDAVFMIDDIKNYEMKNSQPTCLNTDNGADNITSRERNSLYRIIAALSETLLHENSNDPTKPHLKNEAALIQYLDSNYDGYEGLSVSNLQKIYPVAKKLMRP
jgi:hypothetical protein